MPILVIERGNDKGKSLKLAPGKLYVFGRDPEASGIPLSDPLTSRRHFQIAADGGRFALRDLGSTNGTFLNDEPVEEAALRVGDKIQAGETILSFLSDQKEETAQGLVGKVVGGYEILERVGRGGMGTVYKASQLSLNRIVAFKVLSARLLKDSKFIEKFKSEARAAGQLNHPNIVSVYDVGTDRSIHFFSMEYMDGKSLQDKIGKDGKLTWEETLDVLIQASRALIYAEMKHVVHRDVKPDNLMLTSDGQIKLADLGLARRSDQVEGKPEEGIFGTPHFISPEQAQGKEVDHRADLYSLGATAYRLLAGRTPFQGSNVGEIISQQISAHPTPIEKVAENVPDELAAVVAKLMKKNPDERYPTARALLDDLEKIRLKYHLKAHGVGGGKGIYVAVAIALIAVAGVIGFALTRGDNNGGQVTNGGQGTAAPLPTTTAPPEIIIKKDRETLATAEYFKLKAAEPRDLAKSWKTARKAWLDIAVKYEKVAKDYPKTTHGKDSATRAKTIRDTITKNEEQEAERVRAAKVTWGGWESRISSALSEGRYADAYSSVVEAGKDPKLKATLAFLPEAEDRLAKWSGETDESVAKRFQAAFDNVFKDAERLAGETRYAEAVEKLKAFFEKAVGEEKREPFATADREAAGLVERMRLELRSALKLGLESDAARFFEAYRKVRYVQVGDSGSDENPVFDFRFEAAADSLSELLEDGVLKTDLFRVRTEKKIAQLRSMGKLMDAMVAKYNSPEMADKELDLPEELAGKLVVQVTVNGDESPVATREGLKVKKLLRVNGRTVPAQETLAWQHFLASELWQAVFLSGKLWEFSAEEHAAAARFLAETGVLAGLQTEIDDAGDALSMDEKKSLIGELNAITAYRAVLAGRDPDRPEDTYYAPLARWVDGHSTTDYFILVYGFNAPGDKPLLPEKETEAWVDGQLKKLKWK